MIRSVPNPPMSVEDIKTFRNRLKRHMQQSEESPSNKEGSIRGVQKNVIIKLITKNSGGKNPLLS